MRGLLLLAMQAFIVFAVLVGLVWLPSHFECRLKAEAMGIGWSYGLMQGCMIEPRPGQWVPLENYRVVP